MAKNPSITQLDVGQALRRTYDEANDAIRIEVAGGVSFAVALDHTDSVVALGTEDGTPSGTYHAIKVSPTGVAFVRADSISGSTADLSSASAGVVLAPISSSGIKSYQIYAQVDGENVPAAGLAGAITARIDISPTAAGSTFFATSTTLNVPATTALNAVVASSLLTNIIGQRVQLTLTSNTLVGGDLVKFYIVGSSL